MATKLCFLFWGVLFSLLTILVQPLEKTSNTGEVEGEIYLLKGNIGVELKSDGWKIWGN